MSKHWLLWDCSSTQWYEQLCILCYHARKKSQRVSTLNKITLHCGHSDSFCLEKNPSVWIWKMITKARRVEKLLEREHELSQLPTLKWWGSYKSYPWNTKEKAETPHVLTPVLPLLHLDSVLFTCRRRLVKKGFSQLLFYSTNFKHTYTHTHTYREKKEQT